MAVADPAAVYDEFECTGFIPDSDGSFLGYVYTTNSHKVFTDNGVTKVSCHFDHNFELPYATGAQGFACGIINPETGLADMATDSKMLATPGGKATLNCQVKLDN